ncbi:hypothetical protein BKA83DRAFT_4325568 [Pisolithus microcarpus]|nr:hypothetical protein BKA83DRAFT_4325568 [Pisolithus microcarpus]
MAWRWRIVRGNCAVHVRILAPVWSCILYGGSNGIGFRDIRVLYIISPIVHVCLCASFEGIQHPFIQLTSCNRHPSLTLRVVLPFEHTAYLLKIKSSRFVSERSSFRGNSSPRNGRSTRRCFVYSVRCQEIYEGFEGFVGNAVCGLLACRYRRRS